jgi:ubiquinone/menaquinone biosynthesis C-methylase UbiE
MFDIVLAMGLAIETNGGGIKVPSEIELMVSKVAVMSEKEILGQAISTARSWEDLRMMISLPENLKGLRVLDVGGGGSDFTARLLEQKADAYAIDLRYKKTSEIKPQVQKQIVRLTREHPGDSVWKDYIRREEEALERFIKSVKTKPDRYKAASATKLPFPDNYFDQVFSFNCITEYLDLNRSLLFPAVDETLRVTKSGGSIQIFPFQDAHQSKESLNEKIHYELSYRMRRNNQDALLKSLQVNSNVKYLIDGAGPSRNKKLVIFKK